jgi:hypothetical protein
MASRLWLGGLVVAFLARSSFAQTFTETFESGIPPTWTIQDNFPIPGGTGIPAFSAVPWTINTLEGMLNYTNGRGATGAGIAATASSYNHSGQYDVSLITPSFAIVPGADGDTLRYTINYQRVDAFEAFDTNLSINGGPWIVMTHDTSSLGPSYGTGPPKITRSIDMGFFGAVPGDSARVEFRYYSTFLLPMVRNEYVEIDDVVFPSEPVPEPVSLVLGLLAMAFLAARRRHTLTKQCLMRRFSACGNRLLDDRFTTHTTCRRA